jgi:hypothetical protein
MLASKLLELQWTESAFMNQFIERAAQQCFREALLRVIKGRFPTEAGTLDVQWAIAHQTCLARLRQWLDAAGTASTADDFLAVLHR